MQKKTREYIIWDEREIDSILFDLSPGDRIFFMWDLGTGKSTFIRHLLRKHMNDTQLIVRSPTYTYYQKYNTVYHCDLYRLEDYSTWLSIGGAEITEDTESILLIEWPEILGSMVIPSRAVAIELLDTGCRKITITTYESVL